MFKLSDQNSDVKERDTIPEIIKDFRYHGRRITLAGNLLQLKELYATSVASARIENPNQQRRAIGEMRSALRDVLLEPSQRVRHGWFDDML